MINSSKINLLIFIVCFFYALANISKTQAQTGYLGLSAKQNGVEILLDGKRVGRTPLPILQLNQGKYSLWAKNPSRMLWGQFDFHREITIHAAETLYVEIAFPRVIIFRSNPDGAEVYLKNRYIGKTPLYYFDDVEPGTDFILKKNYYYAKTIRFDGKYPAIFNVHLVINEDAYRAYKRILQQQQKRQAFYKKTTFGLWTVAFLSGVSSIYFKQQANNNYQNYLHSASLTKMNRYYDNTLKFDNYSNFGLVTFQISLLASFYTFYKSVNNRY